MIIQCPFCRKQHKTKNQEIADYCNRVFPVMGCPNCDMEVIGHDKTLIIKREAYRDRAQILSDQREAVQELTRCKTLNNRMLTALWKLGIKVVDYVTLTPEQKIQYEQNPAIPAGF